MEEQKRRMEVIIDGKVYTLAGDESEEYMQRIASYVNNKIQELKEVPSYKKLNKEFQSILLALNISDDLYKTKEILKACQEEFDKKDREIYEKNQEILTDKMQMETSDKLVDEYRNKINELQKRIIELETGAR
ncbi:MAG: cell division protein ZapA [Lachnospiraceae bacterium]|nr:cell division protein ZapA [Lachnospiraceae bacterium]